jgi:ribosome-binding protein aMBF1 (putative translation factor)
VRGRRTTDPRAQGVPLELVGCLLGWRVAHSESEGATHDLDGRPKTPGEGGVRRHTARFELGATVRRMREQRGWSQTRLAEAAGMTQSALARFEAGGTVPTLVLERIAEASRAHLIVRFDEKSPAA